MFIGWGIFGMIQHISNRYMKKHWRSYIWVHRISGTMILLITIAMGIVGIKLAGWKLAGDEVHTVIGLIVFFATFFVAVGGVFARSR
jgi:hypothetical protein